ncbi:hypothetical protein SmJEL517_g05388 [Synchytrium microbalum]|uniref:EamA domain-containing protein n=1 Tax=Synchytrium microbalum TaxID=1806994 RepID=A0A507BVS2_9FUNG|nr:uncharacterized protein SmJEL517_g05388 [Synchytrium microbalum]TPX31241.1 hypothetical protein SmJEL517_g05388 [Synchytrium microbalum]
MPHPSYELLSLSELNSPRSSIYNNHETPSATQVPTQSQFQQNQIIAASSKNGNSRYAPLCADEIDDIIHSIQTDIDDDAADTTGDNDSLYGDLSDLKKSLVRPMTRSSTLDHVKFSVQNSVVSMKDESRPPPSNQSRNCLSTNLGLIYMLGAALMFSLLNFAVKSLSSSNTEQKIPLFEMVFIRSFSILIFSVLLMLCQGMNKIHDFLGPQGVRRLLVLRGLTGFLGITVAWLAVQKLSLSDSTVLGFLAPMFTAIAASLILKEPFEIPDAIAGVVSLIGVVFVARPTFIFGSLASVTITTDPYYNLTEILNLSTPTRMLLAISTLNDSLPTNMATITTPNEEDRIIGVILSLIGCLFATSAYISIRFMTTKAKVHPLNILNYFSFVSGTLSLFTIPFMPETWVLPTSASTFGFLSLIAISGFAGQLLMTESLKRETAGRASAMNYIGVVFAFVFDWIAFNTPPNVWSIVGSCIIGSSVIGIAITKSIKSKRAAAKVAKETI